jgi:hypothetical protein
MTSDEQVLGGGRFATDVEGFTAMLAYVAAWPDRVLAPKATEGCDGVLVVMSLSDSSRGASRSSTCGALLI